MLFFSNLLGVIKHEAIILCIIEFLIHFRVYVIFIAFYFHSDFIIVLITCVTYLLSTFGLKSYIILFI